jgi:hypothetical protein
MGGLRFRRDSLTLQDCNGGLFIMRALTHKPKDRKRLFRKATVFVDRKLTSHDEWHQLVGSLAYSQSTNRRMW